MTKAGRAAAGGEHVTEQHQIDPQAEIAPEPGRPVVPPAEHAVIGMQPPVAVVQPECQQSLQRTAFGASSLAAEMTSKVWSSVHEPARKSACASPA